MQRLVPQASIFLDVDDLEDIGALERYIDESAAIMLFLSRGYFLSRWKVVRSTSLVVDSDSL